MKQELDHVLDEVRAAWRFRWVGLSVAFVVALLGWAVVFALPDRYQADARVFVDTRTALKPALQGLTTDQNIDSQINYVRQSLLEGPQLEKIAKDTGVLGPEVVDERARARILDRLSDRIAITVFSAGNQGDERSTAGTIYTFHYADISRERALHVVETLVNTFVEQTLGGKREGSEHAQRFLETQIKDYEQRLSTAEDRLAAFKKKERRSHAERAGRLLHAIAERSGCGKESRDEFVDRNEPPRGTRQAIAQRRGDFGGRHVRAHSQRETGQRRQRHLEPHSRRPRKAKLDELLLKFTDKHPDVIAARATLDELKTRRATELDSLRRGDASAVASSGAGNNPVYQTIQLELNKEDVEIAALRRELAQHQGSVAELRARLNSAPQVEAEFQQLNRDYDVNKAQYTALLESYQKARLGEQADNAGSLRFRGEVVLPPTAPVAPVSPRRTILLAFIWLVSMGVAAGVAYLMNLLKPIVSSVRAVNELTPYPVLGVVSVAFPSRQRREFRRDICGDSRRRRQACLVAAFATALVLNWTGARLTIHAIRALVKT